MPDSVERRWDADPGAYGGRRARASFAYRAFIPDEIAGLHPVAPLHVAELVAEAEQAVRNLNARASVAGLEAIGPLLLRSEAVGSSRLEGYAVSSLNLARALVDPRAARGSARVVARNVSAMDEAVAVGDRPAVSLEDILAIHALLMAGEAHATPGAIRTTQNWIGGVRDNPSDARYIPPPEGEVPRLMEDLVAFVARSDIPAIAQAAIAHAQFETIHPFRDGNGRVGRSLIHVILRKRGVAPAFVPPVSVTLAAHPDRYIEGLVAYREGRSADWIEGFAAATLTAASVATELAERVAALQEAWILRAGRPRADSAASRIIRALPALPVLSAPTVRAVIGSSQQKALDGLKHLEAAGVLRQISPGTYDRQFAATELFDLVAEYEERLAGR